MPARRLPARRFPTVLTLARLLLPVPKSQAQPRLQLETASGQSVFRIGERIPLTLTFTAAEADRYELTNSSSNRQCMLNYDDFQVTPREGWTDPLAAYYSGGCGGRLLSRLALLSSKPTIVQHDLNEWVRFNQPGGYRLTVTSDRVHDAAAPSKPADHLLLTSNAVELRIISATAEWQRARLTSILQQLHTIPAMPGLPLPGRAEAVADLRYLGTAGAIRALAAGLRDDLPDMSYQAHFGLIGVPAPLRAAASNALETQIDDPLFPIGSVFLQTLTSFKATPQSDGPAVQEDWKRSSNAAWQDVFSGLPRKLGQARAVTAQTLLANKPRSLTPEQLRQLSAVLAASFLQPPREQQISELNLIGTSSVPTG